MSDPNARNSGEEGVENSKKDQGLYTKLVRDFARHKLSDADSRSTFTTRVRDTDTIDTFLPEIKNYAGGNEVFDGMEITPEKLNYAVLSRETTSYFSTLSNNRQELKDTVSSEYDVKQKDFSKKADDKIQALEESELLAIIESDTKRRNFLQEVYGEGNIPTEKTLSATLKDFNLEKAYSRIEEGKITDFRRSVEKIQTGQKINTVDLENILGSGVYTGAEQKKILQKILPSMSLARAKDLKLITNEEAQAFKESIVKKNISGGSGYIADIATDMKDEDLVFSTDKILDIKDYREKLLQDPTVLKPFVDKYGAFIDEINDKIEDSSIQKKSDFIQQLTTNPSINNRIVGADKLRVGSILEIEQQQISAEGKTETATLYGEVAGLSDDGKISIIEKGSNVGEKKYNATLKDKTTETYSDFLAFIQKGNSTKRVSPPKIAVMSPEELQEKIRTGLITDESMESIPLVESTDIQSQVGDISKQIEAKEKILEKKQRALLTPEDDNERRLIQSDIESLKAEIEQLKSQHTAKRGELDDVEMINVRVLADAINSIDSDGKDIPFADGVTFETKDDIYTVERIDSATRKVNIIGIGGREPIGFQDFFLNFKNQKAKRISNTKSIDDIVQNGNKGSDFPGAWKNYVVKNGKIRKKGKEDEATKSGINYDYLVAEKGADSEIVKIEKIEGEYVQLSFGELNTKTRKQQKNGKEEKVIDEDFSIFSNLRNKRFHVSYLETYIKKYKLEPRSLNEKNETKKDHNVKDIQKNFHVLSFFFRNLSIMEAVKGGQQFVDQIKEIMQEGQEEHALQFANNYLGRLLPKGGKQELQVRLENSQKKRMEEYLERLKKVGSDVATEMIEGYLLDSHGPEYPKEAAVVFMLQKYGVLNAKRLQKFTGTWTWYQALGGKVGDKLFKEIEKETANEDLPFTEEYLVYILMKKQCAPGGYEGIKRRSKLHKEIKKDRATGKEEEYETGKRDGDDERKIEGRVRGGMGELEKNNYPNAVGWMEQVVNKGGPMELMNKLPFVMAFSGIAYDFEQKTTDQIKKFPAGSRVLMMLRFFSLQSDLDVLNKGILRVCHILQGRGNPKFASIGTEAQAIFSTKRDAGEGNTVKDKLKRTEVFYDKYGKDLTDIMYSLNLSDKGEDLSQLINLEKDKPGNEDLKTYQEMLHGFIDTADVQFTDKDLMTDAFAGVGISGLDLHKVTEQNLIMRQGHWTKHDQGPAVWDLDVRPMFEALPHKIFHPYKEVDDPGNRAIQKKLLKKKLQEFLSGLLKEAGQNQRELLGYNVSTSPFSKLNEWGIDMARIINLPGSISVEGLHHGEAKYQGFLNDFADNIIAVETTGVDFLHQITGEEGEDKLSIGGSVKTGDQVGSIVNGPNSKTQSRTERLLNSNPGKTKAVDPTDDYLNEN